MVTSRQQEGPVCAQSSARAKVVPLLPRKRALTGWSQGHWRGVRLRAQLGQYLLNSVSEVLMRKERAPRGPVWSHRDLGNAQV